MEIHLKPNFQYRLRGTKYSIPAPKPGSAKTGAGEGLILREDPAAVGEYIAGYICKRCVISGTNLHM